MKDIKRILYEVKTLLTDKKKKKKKKKKYFIPSNRKYTKKLNFNNMKSDLKNASVLRNLVYLM
ncbi:hypothetical protein PGB90_008231 [Kerria lacca]